SDTAWPDPAVPGCGAGFLGAAGAGGGTGGAAGGTGGAGGPTLPACGAPPASAPCSPKPKGEVARPSISRPFAALVGRWLLCGHPSVFGSTGDVGLEITADNHWYKLFPAQGGATIRGAGVGEEGTWFAVDMGDHFQVGFNLFGGGDINPNPVFASTPR